MGGFIARLVYEGAAALVCVILRPVCGGALSRTRAAWNDAPLEDEQGSRSESAAPLRPESSALCW